MADIFLSYARADSETMRKLRDDLRAAGLSVWTDEALEPGSSSWQRAIQEQIEGARCLVVILSPEARKSEWVERELALAQELRRGIYPVLARGEVATAVPISIITAQYVDIKDKYEANIQRLIAALKSYLEQAADKSGLRGAAGTTQDEEPAWTGRVAEALQKAVTSGRPETWLTFHFSHILYMDSFTVNALVISPPLVGQQYLLAFVPGARDQWPSYQRKFMSFTKLSGWFVGQLRSPSRSSDSSTYEFGSEWRLPNDVPAFRLPGVTPSRFQLGWDWRLPNDLPEPELLVHYKGWPDLAAEQVRAFWPANRKIASTAPPADNLPASAPLDLDTAFQEIVAEMGRQRSEIALDLMMLGISETAPELGDRFLEPFEPKEQLDDGS